MKTLVVDLLALSVMRRYRAISPEMAIPCIISIGHHLGYITEELFILVLGDEELDPNIRAEMARQLADIQREMGELKLGKLTFPKVLEDAFWVGLEGEGLELSGLQADGA